MNGELQHENGKIDPVAGERKHRQLDFILAGCICAVALGFWLLDPKPAPTPAPAPVSSAAPQVTPSGQLNNEGSQLYSADNFVAAEALFRRAIAADPNGALGYCNLGAALIGEKKYDEAIAVLQRAVALDPSFALARNNLNWALDEKRKHSR
jgi:tetratricopeptide (TPR) repeat protein